VKPRGSSIVTAAVIAIVSALLSSWVIFEIVAFMAVTQIPGKNVVWPKSELPENKIWFGLFWGLLIGVLGYPLWLRTGVIEWVPNLFGLG